MKQAEAEAESKALQGKGIAAERQAIIDGLSASIENFQHGVPGATSEDVMALVLLTQYFDTLRDIGTRGGTNTVFLPNNPGAAHDFQTQIIAGLRGGAAPVVPYGKERAERWAAPPPPDGSEITPSGAN